MFRDLLAIFGIHIHRYIIINKYSTRMPFYYKCECGKYIMSSEKRPYM